MPLDRYHTLLARLPSQSSAFDVARVLQIGEPAKSPPWVKLVEESALTRRAVPSILYAAIKRRGEPAILRALQLYPAAFAPLAVRRVPLEKLLPLAFSNARLGLRIEGLVSRAELRQRIPWVREHWQHAPGVAAGYELALAFSLADARLLVALALKAGKGEYKSGFLTRDRYHTYELPKQSGGTRTITVPDQSLKRLQRRLLDRGFSEVPIHDAAMGFRPGHSITDNARAHVGQPLVVNVDVDSFFPSTSFSLIVRACGRTAGGMLSRRAVMLLADVCSYCGGLPIGAPTSPAIGNIVLERVDRALAGACRRYGITYTRYADDLTFSGPGEVHRILPFVSRVLGECGYSIKERKLNLFRKGRRQVVTGLVVNEKVNLARRLRRRLRAAVHRRTLGEQVHWHGAPMSDSSLLGRISFLQTVQPAEAERHKISLGGLANHPVPGGA
jgi:retron-type reverse transcriptase